MFCFSYWATPFHYGTSHDHRQAGLIPALFFSKLCCCNVQRVWPGIVLLEQMGTSLKYTLCGWQHMLVQNLCLASSIVSSQNDLILKHTKILIMLALSSSSLVLLVCY